MASPMKSMEQQLKELQQLSMEQKKTFQDKENVLKQKYTSANKMASQLGEVCQNMKDDQDAQIKNADNLVNQFNVNYQAKINEYRNIIEKQNQAKGLLSQKIQELTSQANNNGNSGQAKERIAKKDHLIQELQSNIEKKEGGINKMSVLIEKCKQISEGYQQERELLMVQNQRLTQEMEIMQSFVSKLIKMAEESGEAEDQEQQKKESEDNAQQADEKQQQDQDVEQKEEEEVQDEQEENEQEQNDEDLDMEDMDQEQALAKMMQLMNQIKILQQQQQNLSQQQQ